MRLPAKQPKSYNDVSVSDALTSEQRAEVEALIEQYPDVLTSVPGRIDLIQHDINLSTSEPIRSKGYPVPFKARDVMDSEIKEMSQSDGMRCRTNAKYGGGHK